MKIMFCDKVISGETIQKAKQRWLQRTGSFPSVIISEFDLSTLCPELKQKIQKLPKGHFILSDEN